MANNAINLENIWTTIGAVTRDEVSSQYSITSPPKSRYSCGHEVGAVTIIHVTIIA